MFNRGKMPLPQGDSMKVYYPGPGQVTYHPELGKLVAEDPFELADELAEKYVKSGLLKKVLKAKGKAKELEGSDGESTDR